MVLFPSLSHASVKTFECSLIRRGNTALCNIEGIQNKCREDYREINFGLL